MAIIAYTSNSAYSRDYGDVEKLKFPTYASYLGKVSTYEGQHGYTGAANWFNKIQTAVYGDADSGGHDARGVLGKIDYTDNPNKKEFWFRFCFTRSNQWSFPYTGGNQINLLTFYNVNSSRIKVTSHLYIDGDGIVRLAVYDPSEALPNTIKYTQTVGNRSAFTIPPGYDNCRIMDVRVYYSDTGGFVQLYNAEGVMVSEFLGITGNTIKPTHLLLRTVMHYYYRCATVFAIAADEPTFGMYVAQIAPKAEGGLQDQLTGTNGSFYYGYAKHYLDDSSYSVQIKAEPGTRKSYTYKLNTPTDIGMPANFTVRSVKLSGGFGAVNSAGSTVPIDLTLRYASDSTTFNYKMQPLTPDNTFTVNQTRHKTLDINPKTGLAWTQADLADLELGFSVFMSYSEIVGGQRPLFFLNSDLAPDIPAQVYGGTAFTRLAAVGVNIGAYTSDDVVSAPVVGASIVAGNTQSIGLTTGGKFKLSPTDTYNWVPTYGYYIDGWLKTTDDAKDHYIAIKVGDVLYSAAYDHATASYVLKAGNTTLASAAVSIAQAAAIDNNTPSHVAMRFNFPGGNISATMFVNGVEVVTANSPVTVTGNIEAYWSARFVDQLFFVDELVDTSNILARYNMGK